MRSRSSLRAWGIKALNHWKEFRPKMYAELEQRGELIEAAYKAQEWTLRSFGLMIEDNIHPDVAWELVREDWILLPAEEDVPVLEWGPETWPDPPVFEDDE